MSASGDKGPTPVDDLRDIRESLLHARRTNAKEALGADGLSIRRVERVIELQEQIEAIDRAIADEEGMRPSRYEQGGLAGA